MENMLKSRKKWKLFVAVTILIIACMIVGKPVKAVEATAVPLSGEQVNPYARDVMPINEEIPDEKIDGIFDGTMTSGVYKFSDNAIPKLPFLRYAADRMLIDQSVGGLGTSFSGKAIEVTAPLKGLQVLLSNDTVRVASDMEYAIIFASGNVTIDASMAKSTIIFAGGTVTIGDKAVLEEDIICYATDVVVNGTIKGSLLGGASKVTINGTIEQDLRVHANEINVKSQESVKGNVYVQTYNKDLKLTDTFPNAVVKILELKSGFNISMVTNGIVTCLLFTLVLLTINKVAKKDIFAVLLAKIKIHPIFTIASGALMIVLMPFIVMILVILSAMGLYAIAVPLLFIYAIGTLVVGLLSTFIVGSTIASYMTQHYFKEKGAILTIVGTFFSFASLYVLARIPYIGGYIAMALVIVAIGMIMNLLFKKQK